MIKRCALCLLFVFWGAAQGQTTVEEAPTVLVSPTGEANQEATPDKVNPDKATSDKAIPGPTEARVPDGRSVDVTDSVRVSGLEAVDVDTFGLVSPENSEFGLTPWQGYAYEEVLQALARLPSRVDKVPLRGLMRSLLVAQGRAPESEARDRGGRLFALRVVKLFEWGFYPDVVALVNLLPVAERTPMLRSLRRRALAGMGAFDGYCVEEAPAHPLESLVCMVHQRQWDQADLLYNVLLEQNKLTGRQIMALDALLYGEPLKAAVRPDDDALTLFLLRTVRTSGAGEAASDVVPDVGEAENAPELRDLPWPYVWHRVRSGHDEEALSRAEALVHLMTMEVLSAESARGPLREALTPEHPLYPWAHLAKGESSAAETLVVAEALAAMARNVAKAPEAVSPVVLGWLLSSLVAQVPAESGHGWLAGSMVMFALWSGQDAEPWMVLLRKQAGREQDVCWAMLWQMALAPQGAVDWAGCAALVPGDMEPHSVEVLAGLLARHDEATASALYGRLPLYLKARQLNPGYVAQMGTWVESGQRARAVLALCTALCGEVQAPWAYVQGVPGVPPALRLDTLWQTEALRRMPLPVEAVEVPAGRPEP